MYRKDYTYICKLCDRYIDETCLSIFIPRFLCSSAILCMHIFALVLLYNRLLNMQDDRTGFSVRLDDE